MEPAPQLLVGHAGLDLSAAAVSVLLLASGTSAALNIATPNNASLGGLAVYYQALGLHPAAANAAHALVTDAGKATLGAL